MKLDFDEVPQMQDYVSIPAGHYVCRVDDIRHGTTRNGDERWSLRLVVAEGEYAGRQAAWDGLVFSTRGMARVRRVFGALGLPNRGRVEIQPDDLRDRRALIEVRPVEYMSPSGEMIRRNEVPYDGFRPVPGGEADVGASEDGTTAEGPEIPF